MKAGYSPKRWRELQLKKKEVDESCLSLTYPQGMKIQL